MSDIVVSDIKIQEKLEAIGGRIEMYQYSYARIMNVFLMKLQQSLLTLQNNRVEL